MRLAELRPATRSPALRNVPSATSVPAKVTFTFNVYQARPAKAGSPSRAAELQSSATRSDEKLREMFAKRSQWSLRIFDHLCKTCGSAQSRKPHWGHHVKRHDKEPPRCGIEADRKRCRHAGKR